MYRNSVPFVSGPIRNDVPLGNPARRAQDLPFQFQRQEFGRGLLRAEVQVAQKLILGQRAGAKPVKDRAVKGRLVAPVA